MSIFDKLTDPKLYTGAHKERFDSDGRGRGLAGRDGGAFNGQVGPSGMGAVHLRPTLTSGTTSARVGRPQSGQFGNNDLRRSNSNPRGTSPGLSARGNTVADPYGAGGGRPLFRPSNGGSDGPAPTSSRTPRSGRRAGGGGGSIFDKLTDPKQYTGAHRERFDESGRGKGLQGREPGGEYAMGGALHLRPQYGKI